MKNIFIVSVLSMLVTACAHRIDGPNITGVESGETVIVNHEIAVVHCNIFTSSMSFWGGPSSESCLMSASSVRPNSGRDTVKTKIPPPVMLKVIKVTEINGIDFVEKLIFVQDVKTNSRYIVRSQDSRDIFDPN